MEPSIDEALEASREVRELCFSGDWACADGNLEVLRYVACRVAAYAAQPLQYQLLVLAEMCRDDPAHAIAIWLHLKNRMIGRAEYLPS